MLHPVSPVKEHYRKGGKCNISWFLQSPVSSPQASSKVEARDSCKQAQHLLLAERFKMEPPESFRASLIPGEWVSSIDRRLPSHLHPPSLKEVLPLFRVPVHLPLFST